MPAARNGLLQAFLHTGHQTLVEKAVLCGSALGVQHFEGGSAAGRVTAAGRDAVGAAVAGVRAAFGLDRVLEPQKLCTDIVQNTTRVSYQPVAKVNMSSTESRSSVFEFGFSSTVECNCGGQAEAEVARRTGIIGAAAVLCHFRDAVGVRHAR